MQYIEEQVTSVLHDVRAEVAPAANSNEDVVASLASLFAQQKGRPAIRGKPQRQQFQRQQSLPRSRIMKKTTQRVSAAVWAKMSQEARDQLRQENKESQRRQRGGRGGRGRGGSAVQVQRRIANEAEEEVDIAEAGGVQCFDSEITEELSTMSELGRAEKEIPLMALRYFLPTDQEVCESVD